VKIVPICICFVAHLICVSPAKIKAAKSQICIIDRANSNTRGDTVGRVGSEFFVVESNSRYPAQKHGLLHQNHYFLRNYNIFYKTFKVLIS
jgi:hypothetical protein